MLRCLRFRCALHQMTQICIRCVLGLYFKLGLIHCHPGDPITYNRQPLQIFACTFTPPPLFCFESRWSLYLSYRSILYD